MQPLVQLLAAWAGSAGFALLFNMRGEKLFWGALGGLLSWGVYLLAGLCWQSGPLCCFAAALVLTVYAEVMARLHKTPVTVFLVAGTIPLIPGGTLYRTMGYAVAYDWPNLARTGVETLLWAAAIAGGILACMVLWHIGELALGAGRAGGR